MVLHFIVLPSLVLSTCLYHCILLQILCSNGLCPHIEYQMIRWLLGYSRIRWVHFTCYIWKVWLKMKLANIDMNSTEHDGSTGDWETYEVVYGFDIGMSQKCGTVNARGHIISFGNEGYAQAHKGVVWHFSFKL
jgi:hypothetical protein